MKKFGILSTVALAILVLAATPAAQAACGAGAGALYSGFSPIYSNPAWPGGSFCTGCGPAMSGAHTGSFWALGFGDQAGVGVDNGSFGAPGWLGAAFPDSPPFYFFGAFIGGWGSTLTVEGCPLTDVPAGTCTCAAVCDDLGAGSVGVFANWGATFDGAKYNMDIGAPMPLVPMPTPVVTTSQGFGNGSVDVTVRVDPPVGGVYIKDGCGCGPVGYKIRAVTNANGVATTTTPGTRVKSAWTELTLGDGTDSPPGTAQPITALGSTVTVHATCSDVTELDVYLVTEMYFDNGAAASGPFNLDHVSADSLQIECGPNLADPDDTTPRGRIRNQSKRSVGRSGR